MGEAKVSDVVSHLYEAVVQGNSLETPLNMIARTFPDIRFAFQSQCVIHNNFYQLDVLNFDDDAMSDFAEMAHLNPFPKYVMQASMHRIGRTAAFVSPEQIEKTEFYDGFFRKRDEINRGSAIILHRRSTDSAFFVANIPGKYSEHDELALNGFLDATRPHFQNAFSLLLELNKRRQETIIESFWLDQIPTIAFVVDDQLKLLRKNSRAEAFLNDRQEVRLDRNHQVALVHNKDRKRFHDLVRQASSADRPSEPIRLTSSPGQSKLAYAVPIGSEHAGPFIVRPPRAEKQNVLVLVFDPQDIAPSSVDALRMGLGLTERESAVVQSLIDGNSLRDAADGLGITYNTARNHMAMATDKTGANSQTAIVKMGTQVLSRMPGKGR